ncbi:dephospho-CoA kinase [Planktotalea sp.]|uniref:dephospho-CoA kinase n=1 Tax=Planktotalea sp. TaxID=2029877 RepID=UPI0025F8EBAE|nr:dephospho-CoA kinase [Planktotalea sp.]
MSFLLGITGSIGMGKSTTAQMFADAGCAVWDADAAVHQLYAPNGLAIAPIAVLVPDALQDNVLDRTVLRNAIRADASLLSKIEAIVHPLVGASRDAFKADAASEILVFDTPLLFETGGNVGMDAVACVWTNAETQKERVLSRGTMSEDDFAMILSRQMPIEEKRALSDYVIETDTLDHARAQVAAILADIKGRLTHA